jgi:CDP-glucose 4,6-dehydratase
MEKRPGKFGTDVPVNVEFWRNRRVLVTGHTGFKGAWLSLWLQSMGAEIQGVALAPGTKPSLFERARVGLEMRSSIRDIRDLDSMKSLVREFKPEILLHLAAQPLVRASYAHPVETYSTNIMGTVNMLEAARNCDSVRAIVNVTTDKCYENKEWVWGYRETDAMGGHDPYSSSKGCSELITAAYRSSFFSKGTTLLATARAGNVIGGGDWAADRLVPDILRAFESDRPAVLRNPRATRPWQHVLEPLAGYLELAEKLYFGLGHWDGAWNLGPVADDVREVGWVADYLAFKWGHHASWRTDNLPQPHEAKLLRLDITKATTLLDWRPHWTLSKALDKTVDWQMKWLAGCDIRQLCIDQIKEYSD